MKLNFVGIDKRKTERLYIKEDFNRFNALDKHSHRSNGDNIIVKV